MKTKELKKLIEEYKKDSYENEFQIVTSLDKWNQSINWDWGTEADDNEDENDEYSVEVNFIDNNFHVTLVPTKERMSGSVRNDASWPVEEYIDEFYDELIENAEIFYRGRY